MIKNIYIKLKESLLSVLPIYLLVIVLNMTPLINLSGSEVWAFSFSTIFLVIGISLFNLGADMAMRPMGKYTGAGLTKYGKIFLLLAVGFVLGFLVTIAEPDLAVLAEQTKAVFNSTLFIVCIALGVGGFLMLAILKTILRVNLSHLLMFFYMVLFAITLLAYATNNENIIPLAFDSGGVTTGPITVPFLMALGVGVSSIVSKKSDKDASFGLIALCSIGPVAVILLLSIFTSGRLTYDLPNYEISDNIFLTYIHCFGEKLGSVGIALGLIVICFCFCLLFIKISKKRLWQIGIGILYTYLGLVIFLAAVDSSYLAIGYKIGTNLSTISQIGLVVICFATGALTVLAEPAIHVLNEQVQEITDGLVKKKSLMIALVIGVGIAVMLSCIRIIYQFSIIYYILPGYIICLGLSFFIPKIYTAIAFDSGGVASGPLASTFILPMMIGICNSLSGPEAILTDAFGVVALIAMAPLITIEILGLIVIVKEKIKSKRIIREALKQDDKVIIEFER